MLSVRLRSLSVLVAGLTLGCAAPARIPPPEAAVARYAEALERGDADAVHALLGAEGRRMHSRDDVRRILDEQRDELRDQARAFTAPGRTVEATARIPYPDGESAVLELRDGRFAITAATALPANPRTPTQALAALRAVLARRSYAGLVRILSPRTRAAVESDLRSLVEGLAEPEALDVEVKGDVATVVVPGGHRVKLRREDGAWHVDDLD